MCSLVATLANQQQFAEALAYVQKLFQLRASEADGQSLVPSAQFLQKSRKAAF
jgi:hypothetical protein